MRCVLSLFVAVLLLIGAVDAVNLMGCKFDETLCGETEECVNDQLFGRCDTSPFTLTDYSQLRHVALRALGEELNWLISTGATWHQARTQCALMFFSLSYRLDWDWQPRFCDVAQPEVLLEALRAIEAKVDSESDVVVVVPDDVRLQAMEDEPVYDDVAEEALPIAQEDITPLLEERMEQPLYEDIQQPLEDSIEQPLEESMPEEEPLEESMPAEEPLEVAYDEPLVLEAEGMEEPLIDEPVISEVKKSSTDDDLEHVSDLFGTDLPAEYGLPDEELVLVNEEPEPTEAVLVVPDVSSDQQYEFPTYDPVDLTKEDYSAEDLPTLAGEVAAMKKDEEQLGALDQGTGAIPHVRHKGNLAEILQAPTVNDVRVEDGNRVILNTKTEVSDETAYQVVRELEARMGLMPETFYDIERKSKTIAFRVDPASGFSASDLVQDIPVLVGANKARRAPAKKSIDPALSTSSGDVTTVPTLLVCGAVMAVLVVALAGYMVRSNGRARQVLRQLAGSEAAAGDDYEDLCRQHAIDSKSTLIDAHGRVASGVGGQGKSSSTSSWSDEPVSTNMDITTGHMILSYMEEHLNNQDKLDHEWASLSVYTPDDQSARAGAENEQLNRCADMLPFDHNRVHLNRASTADGSDYINASAISDHDPRYAAYIAASNPLPNTMSDFWQMIWDQGAVVIVNLTRKQDRVDRYWPEEGSIVYGNFEVHLVSEHIWCEDYLVRSFYLKNLRTAETRTVTQFHYVNWPEHGCPSATRPLLEFRRKVNKSYRGRSCPIIVHCTDGSGRTGTYILMDMVLNRINKGLKEIDIAATLEHLRDQRMCTVETKEQFSLVLTMVAEEVQAMLKALPQ